MIRGQVRAGDALFKFQREVTIKTKDKHTKQNDKDKEQNSQFSSANWDFARRLIIMTDTHH